MTIDEYQNIISQYDELLKQSVCIPQREKIIESKLDFVSKAFVNPAYTMKASWFVEEGECFVIDRVMTMHPYDYVLTYSSLTKDWDKALTMLQKYIHEKIDSWK